MELKSYLIIDRIEGEIAVCEDDAHRHFEIRLANISGTAREGDLLYPDPDGSRYQIDAAATARRRRELLNRQRNLFEKHGGNNVK